jgi:hypothetical protein
MACAMVEASTYSSSPPTGTPRASRLTARLALLGEVGGQDHLGDLAIAGALEQALQPELARAHAIERREPAHEHEVPPLEGQGLLDHGLIGRGLDHAEQAGVASRRGAGLAQLGIGEGVAQPAAPEPAERGIEGTDELARALAVVLQQVVGVALRGTRADPGQPAQGLHQRLEQAGRRGGLHGRGNALRRAA